MKLTKVFLSLAVAVLSSTWSVTSGVPVINL